MLSSQNPCNNMKKRIFFVDRLMIDNLKLTSQNWKLNECPYFTLAAYKIKKKSKKIKFTKLK